WSVLAEVPNVAGFEAASKYVRPEDLAGEIPHGPDVQAYVDAIEKFTDAGFDHVVLMAAGEDQAPFLRFFEEELSPALKSNGAARPGRRGSRAGGEHGKGAEQRH